LFFSCLFALVAACVLAILLWRRLVHLYESDSVWAALVSKTPWHDDRFDESMVADLPVAARRFFLFAIRPGTSLRTVVELKSTANILNGRRRSTEVEVYQVLAAPYGSLSRYDSTNSLFALSGTSLLHDERASVRFWRWKVFALACRSASNILFERMGIEAALWSPAALLPRNDVVWHEVNETTARAVMAWGELSQSIEIIVQPTGRLECVRSTGPNATTATPENFRRFSGYCLPTEVEFQKLHEATLPSRSKIETIRFVGPWIGSSHT
jgi:hypothetical protein